jgi:integrase
VCAHRKRLVKFAGWCDEQGIDNLNDLTGRILHEYRLWRREDGNLAPPSEKSQMDTLRVFVRWLESIDGVAQDLGEKAISATVEKGEFVRDVMLESDRADKVLEYLGRYHYASREHVAISLMWHTMMRVGAIHALDVEDYDSEDQCLKIVHRPDTGTPIKNQNRGERLVELLEDKCETFDDWITHQRSSVEDDAGRNPLIATEKGCANTSTLRNDVYRFTRSCAYGEECPHDRDPGECEATSYKSAAQCPSSISLHPIRRGPSPTR